MSELNVFSSGVTEQQENLISELKKANTEFSQLIEKQICANKIDGQIIGTGVDDFTRDNVVYQFEHNNKEFQLIDVPGIEGDESKFEQMVEAAVAKAHVVFFVNGTAKKPEIGTAKKIKKYLRHGTNLQPIINVRGFADQYEFPEDREELTNKAIKSASEQTYTVLSNELDQEIVMQPVITQGLLAFCGLAYLDEVSTIHPSREKDLGRIQSKYLEVFSTPSEMLKFSNIHSVASVLKTKLETIEDEIVESNKRKAINLLDKSVEMLLEQKEGYIKFLESSGKDFALCKEEINSCFDTAKKDLKRKRKLRINNYIAELKDNTDQIVEDYFGEDDVIRYKVELKVQEHTANLYAELDSILEKEFDTFSKKAKQATERLLQNIENTSEMLVVSSLDMGFKKLTLSGEDILNLKNLGSWALNIGGYAASGVAIGSIFPVVGNIVGGIAGAVVGILKSIWDFFSSKEKRMRKMQGKVHDVLDEMNEELFENEKEFTREAINELKKYKVELENELDSQFLAIKRLLTLIEKNIKLMSDIHIKMKDKPYGTI